MAKVGVRHLRSRNCVTSVSRRCRSRTWRFAVPSSLGSKGCFVVIFGAPSFEALKMMSGLCCAESMITAQSALICLIRSRVSVRSCRAWPHLSRPGWDRIRGTCGLLASPLAAVLSLEVIPRPGSAQEPSHAAIVIHDEYPGFRHRLSCHSSLTPRRERRFSAVPTSEPSLYLFRKSEYCSSASARNTHFREIRGAQADTAVLGMPCPGEPAAPP